MDGVGPKELLHLLAYLYAVPYLIARSETRAVAYRDKLRLESMATSDPVYKTIVDITTKGAGAFVDIFYKTLDTNRSVIHKFYRPSSRIVWNGNPHLGKSIAISDIQC